MNTVSAASNQTSVADNPAALGKAIAAARRACGLTQQELCEQTGIAYSTLTKIERGAIKKPNVFTVLQIAQISGLRVEDLLGGAAARPPANPHPPSRTATVAPSPPAAGIKFVYFDLHEVLVNSVYAMMPFIAAKAGQPLDKVENLFLRFDKGLCLGKLSAEEFDRLLSEEMNCPGLKQADLYLQHVKADQRVIGVLEQLRGVCRIGLLTNAFPGEVEELTTRGIIPDDFDVVVDSSAIGKVKPERDIYEHAQRAAGVEAAEILLIDDRLINIVAAEACGWQGLRLNEAARVNLRGRLGELLNF